MKCTFSAILLFSVLSLATLCGRRQKPKREFQLQADWRISGRSLIVTPSYICSRMRLWFYGRPGVESCSFLIVSDDSLCSTSSSRPSASNKLVPGRVLRFAACAPCHGKRTRSASLGMSRSPTVRGDTFENLLSLAMRARIERKRPALS